jgi:hypothetical protein
VVHACNPSYSGGREQEDCGSELAQANSLRDLISKIPNIKKGWQSGLSGGVPAYHVWGTEFKPQYLKQQQQQKTIVWKDTVRISI